MSLQVVLPCQWLCFVLIKKEQIIVLLMCWLAALALAPTGIGGSQQLVHDLYITSSTFLSVAMTYVAAACVYRVSEGGSLIVTLQVTMG